TQVNPGFDHASIQTFRMLIPETVIPDGERVLRMEQDMLDKVAAVPGVSGAAVAGSIPLDDQHWFDPVYASDHSYADGKLPPLRRFKFVSPEYLRVQGVPLIAGRGFTWADNYQKLPVAMVTLGFAREYWGTPQNALGKRI